MHSYLNHIIEEQNIVLNYSILNLFNLYNTVIAIRLCISFSSIFISILLRSPRIDVSITTTGSSKTIRLLTRIRKLKKTTYLFLLILQLFVSSVLIIILMFRIQDYTGIRLFCYIQQQIPKNSL